MQPYSKTSPEALGREPIGSLLMQYSFPAIVASVATSLYNIIDSIFIGRGVGTMAIAGLAITFPLMNLVVAFCMFIAVGGAAIESIFLGQKNLSRANDVLNNVIMLCLIHSVVFGGLAIIFLDPILTLFGATPQTAPYAREFMEVILYGSPISFVFIGLNNLLRATGYPRKAMVSALLSVAANIILAPLLIFKCDWGIRGAAFATICGQTIALIWVLAHFLNKNSYVHLNTRLSWFKWQVAKRIYTIGLSPFLMNVCACVVVVFINRALLDYGGENGDIAVGAYGILNRTTMFFIMIVFGVTQGMQPILGYNYGARKVDRVKKTLHIGIAAGMSITAFGWIITEIAPGTVSSLFTVDRNLIEMANRGFRIYFILFPLVGCQIVIQNFFQSIGHPIYSIAMSLTRQLLFLIPFLIILPAHFGIDGVWAAMAASDTLAFIVAVSVLWWVKRGHGNTLSTTVTTKSK